MECRRRWDEMNNTKKNNSRIGDALLKFGCDDISAAVAFITYIEEEVDDTKKKKSDK